MPSIWFFIGPRGDFYALAFDADWFLKVISIESEAYGETCFLEK